MTAARERNRPALCSMHARLLLWDTAGRHIVSNRAREPPGICRLTPQFSWEHMLVSAAWGPSIGSFPFDLQEAPCAVNCCKYHQLTSNNVHNHTQGRCHPRSLSALPACPRPAERISIRAQFLLPSLHERRLTLYASSRKALLLQRRNSSS